MWKTNVGSWSATALVLALALAGCMGNESPPEGDGMEGDGMEKSGDAMGGDNMTKDDGDGMMKDEGGGDSPGLGVVGLAAAAGVVLAWLRRRA